MADGNPHRLIAGWSGPVGQVRGTTRLAAAANTATALQNETDLGVWSQGVVVQH